MATTSSNRTAGAAIGGQGGQGQGRKGRAAGLVATAVVGLTLLTGLVLGRAHQEAPPAGPPAAVNQSASGTGDAPGQFTYREDHRATAANPFIPDRFTYREDRREGVAAPFVPDQFTYREDHHSTAVALFVPDQFTYREDHR